MFASEKAASIHIYPMISPPYYPMYLPGPHIGHVPLSAPLQTGLPPWTRLVAVRPQEKVGFDPKNGDGLGL